ncbi:histamine N-methyltransferase-like [Lytechinus variegatus]|uniref:histamine N-methyltransferase-like n=1 Tax=Lytechinus variegatus TaxID=7654 RepID=UPI001BB26FBC|nr:histamine N-methyltransferase-like [Lytechinus variegatus]
MSYRIVYVTNNTNIDIFMHFAGEMDSKMAASIKSRFSSVRNVVLDPSEKQLQMYRSLIESNQSAFKGIEFDLRQLSIDKYRTNGEDHPPKYHFINAVQSLYYVDDVKDTVRYLYDHLEKGGVMLITIVSDTCGFWRLYDTFPRLRDNVGHYMCINQVRQCLYSLGLTFEEKRQPFHADISSCFQDGSTEGAYLIDFITQINDLRGTASPDFYREVVDFLGSSKCSKRKEDGTILLINDWDAVVVQKPVSS